MSNKKVLRLRRHSTKDGAVPDTIGPKGLALAKSEGEKDRRLPIQYLFHGPLVRTAQTCGAYIMAQADDAQWMPVVPGLGDDALFAQMVTDDFRAEVKKGQTNFAAVLAAHGDLVVKTWAETCAMSVRTMLDLMDERAMAAGFFHSPTIEWAAWAINEFKDLLPELTQLGDMEGIEFEQDENGLITISSKIVVVN